MLHPESNTNESDSADRDVYEPYHIFHATENRPFYDPALSDIPRM